MWIWASWMKPNWIFLSMPLVIRPLDGLGFEGVPCLNVGLIGVTSGGVVEGGTIVRPVEFN